MPFYPALGLTNIPDFTGFFFCFQLAQKLREEHDSASVVIIEDGNESAGLHGDEKETFEKFLPLDTKQV